MRQLQHVLWTKGTLLTPQHLQIQDRFVEDSLQFWLESLTFNPWGFRELRIDHEALAAGVLTVSKASGIFRDGLLFEIPDADPAPPAKQLGEHFGPNDSSVDVYLAVPQYRERGLNVSIPGAASDTRYLASAVFVPDEGSAGVEKPIQVARKGFRVLVESESRQGYSTLRIARIQRTPAGAFLLDTRFVPPLLDLSTSELLLTIARRLFEILGAKSTELAALRREKNQSLADFTSSEIADFWMLYTINTNFPSIRVSVQALFGMAKSRWEIGVSREGYINQSVRVRPRPKDSGLVAREVSWRESKTTEPSDNMLRKEYAQLTRLQRTVNADVASLHQIRWLRRSKTCESSKG